MNQPVFIQADNYNYLLTLKQWLCEPSVFFILFIWILATILSVKIYDSKPFKWVLVLTIFLLIFRVFNLKTHPEPVTVDQATQIATAAANAPLPPVVAPKATPVVTPTGTPSAQLITN